MCRLSYKRTRSPLPEPRVLESIIPYHSLQSPQSFTGLALVPKHSQPLNHFDGSWCLRDILVGGLSRWLTSTRTFVLLVYQQLETKKGQHNFQQIQDSWEMVLEIVPYPILQGTFGMSLGFLGTFDDFCNGGEANWRAGWQWKVQGQGTLDLYTLRDVSVGFHKWGYPNSWIVCSGKIPI